MSIKSDAIEVLTTKWDTAGYQPGSFIDLVMKIYACACGQCDYYNDTPKTACSSNGMSEAEIISDGSELTGKTTSKIFNSVEGALAFSSSIVAPTYRRCFYSDFKSDDPGCSDAVFFYPLPERYAHLIKLTTPEDRYLYICIGNGFYVLVSSYSSYMAVSTDGNLFTNVPMPAGLLTNNLFLCVFTGAKFIIVPNADENTSKVAVATNPASGWELSDIGDNTHKWSLAASDGSGVVIVSTESQQYTSETSPIYRRSLDHGATWQGLAYPASYFPFVSGLGTSYVYSLSYINGKFIAVIGFAKTISISSDKGATWSSPTGIPFVGSIAYGDGVYVLASKDSAAVAISYDLLSWEEVALDVYGDGDSYPVDLVVFADSIFTVAAWPYGVLYWASAEAPSIWHSTATPTVTHTSLAYDGSSVYIVGQDKNYNIGAWKITTDQIQGESIRIRAKRPEIAGYESFSNDLDTYNYINDLVASESVSYSDSDGVSCKRFVWDYPSDFTTAMQILASRSEFHAKETENTAIVFSATIDGCFHGGRPSRFGRYMNPTPLPDYQSFLCAVFEFTSDGIVNSKFYYCICVRGPYC